MKKSKYHSSNNVVRATRRAIKAIMIWLNLLSFMLVVHMMFSGVM